MSSACASLSFSWGSTPTPTAAPGAPSSSATPSGGSSAAPSAASGPTSTEYQDAAESISLTAAELSPFSVHPPVAAIAGAAASGWSLIADNAMVVTGLKTGCQPDIYPVTAGWYREYSYDLEPNDGEEGHGTLSVEVIDTPADAAAEQASVAGDAYGLCYQSQVTGEISNTAGAAVTGSVTLVTESVDAGVPSYMRLYSFPYTWASQSKINYDTVVWLQYGRYRAILDLWTCCGQPPVSDFQPDAQLLGARMRAAPA
jgi:hypothetical protein